MGNPLKNFLGALVRRKKVTTEGAEVSQLNRCLSTFDLTLLGVGGTLGLGIYVLAGQVASTKAGPAVVLSFLIAAVASVFSGLCYAEFGARVPKAGSAYVYSYVTVGEFMAFVIGWNLILEYVIGTASVARGYSGYMDSLLNHTIETHFREWMPLGVSWLSTYPDVFALAITLFLAGMLAIGVKESTRFNNVFTLVNLLVVVYVVIVGAFKADIRNWQLKPEDIPRNDTGVGGFFPYGVGGMLNGAASCFYAFVGFDCIATMGEEVRNPRRAIPIGIVVSLTIVFLAYFGVSVIETLVWPYWDQNVSAPLPYVFDRAGWPVAKWVVSIGALAGLSTRWGHGIFCPRTLGLVYKNIVIAQQRSTTTILKSLLPGALHRKRSFRNLRSRASLAPIKVMHAHSCWFQKGQKRTSQLVSVQGNIPGELAIACAADTCDSRLSAERYEVPSQSHGETGTLDNDALDLKPRSSVTTMFNSDGLQSPTTETSYLVKVLTLVLGVLFCTMNGILVFAEGPFFNGDLPVVIPFAGVALLAVLCIIVISRQPSASTESLSFAVPFVPYIPMFNMFVNLYLMMRLPPSTWVRFVVWMVLGFLIYFGYGIFNSSQRKPSPPFLRDAASVDSVLSSDNQSDGEAQPLMSC
ncbi:unnamed protein product [Ixodes pacificus]